MLLILTTRAINTIFFLPIARCPVTLSVVVAQTVTTQWLRLLLSFMSVRACARAAEASAISDSACGSEVIQCCERPGTCAPPPSPPNRTCTNCYIFPMREARGRSYIKFFSLGQRRRQQIMYRFPVNFEDGQLQLRTARGCAS